jgi:type VI protein secretion system component VasK
VLKYERGDYTSTMGALHRYLVGELMVHSMDACREIASMPESSAPSSDIFVTRMRQFGAAVAARCVPGSSAGAVASYQRLRTYFQTRLAGRYPFVDTATATRSEAVISDVRDFLRQYDVFAVAGEPALRSDPTLAYTARAATTFLEQFEAVRPVLSALDAAARRDAVFTYGITVAAGALLDSLNTASVDVRIGDRQVALDHTAQSFVWKSGDAITAVLTPLDPSLARTLASYAGPWAALRFLRHPSGMDVKLFHPETNMPLTLPLFPVSAPDIVVLRNR